MKPTTFTLSILALSFALLQSCELFFGSTTTSTTSTTIESVELTSGALVGTWTYDSVSSLNSNDVIYPLSINLTLSFASDGTYVSRSSTYKLQNAGGAFVPYEFRDNRGLYAFTSDSLTLTVNETRLSTLPFPDNTSSWTNLATPQLKTDMALIARGILHTRSVYKAEGTTSGIVGAWARLMFVGSESLYFKAVYTFGTDGIVSLSEYISPTTTFPLEPSYPPYTFAYSVVGDQISSPGTSSSKFAIYGSYLVLGIENGLGGWTKTN